MSEIEPSGLCHNCVGACCRASVIIPLNETEAANLSAAGTVLKEFLPAGEGVDWAKRRYFNANTPDDRKFVRRHAKFLNAGQGLFGFDSDCGFLEETEDNKFICGVHDDPSLKPEICSDFTAGKPACQDIRENVIKKMYEEDSLIPSLAGVALGEEVFRNFEDS